MNHNPHEAKADRGMSIPSVLIAVAIMAILGAQMTRMFTNQRNQTVLVETNYEIAGLVNSMRSHLADSEACAESFADLNPVSNEKIDKIKELKTADGAVRFAVDQKYGNNMVKITKFTLEGFERDTPTAKAGRAQFKITMERSKTIGGSGKSIGPKVVSKKIDLFLILKKEPSSGAPDKNEIATCHELSGTTLAETYSLLGNRIYTTSVSSSIDVGEDKENIKEINLESYPEARYISYNAECQIKSQNGEAWATVKFLKEDNSSIFTGGGCYISGVVDNQTTVVKDSGLIPIPSLAAKIRLYSGGDIRSGGTSENEIEISLQE